MVRHEAAEGLAALCVGGRNSALEEQVLVWFSQVS